MLQGDTFWDLLERRVDATPDAPMLIDERDRRITFAQYRDAALRAAAGFSALGVEPGDPVAFQLPTRIETAVLMGALARLGAVQNPIVPLFREVEIAHCLVQADASLFCIPESTGRVDYENIADAASEGLDVRILACDPALPDGEPTDLPPPPSDGDAVRWIYYTSGTTGRPRGARHTDQTLATVSAGLAPRVGSTPEDAFGMAFPFTHVGGLMNLLCVLHVGYPMVMMEAFDAEEAIRLFHRHRVTIVGGGPVFFQAFLEQQRKQPDTPVLPHMRIFSGGGAPMPSELFYEVQREMNGVRCVHGWGMTECGIVCTNDAFDPDAILATTEGRPGEGVELEVRTRAGEPAAVDEEGPIRIRGPAVCKGYLDPEAHAESFDAEGWFETGDVGRRDAHGYVTLTGRMKDIIIRKGENISANEIEDILYAHPKIGDAAVIGVPDRERGEMVCAVVTAAEGSPPPSFDEVVRHFRAAKVMPQKIPERLEVVEAMPRNPTGKILKRVLSDRYGSEPATGPGATPGGSA